MLNMLFFLQMVAAFASGRGDEQQQQPQIADKSYASDGEELRHLGSERPRLGGRPTKELLWQPVFARDSELQRPASTTMELEHGLLPPLKKGSSKASSAHLLAQERRRGSSYLSLDGSREPVKPATTSSPKGPPPRLMYGIPKLAWAIICDVLAMLLVILCVPLVLACSKRRPPGQSMFSMSEPPVMYDRYEGLDWPPTSGPWKY